MEKKEREKGRTSCTAPSLSLDVQVSDFFYSMFLSLSRFLWLSKVAKSPRTTYQSPLAKWPLHLIFDSLSLRAHYFQVNRYNGRWNTGQRERERERMKHGQRLPSLFISFFRCVSLPRSLVLLWEASFGKCARESPLSGRGHTSLTLYFVPLPLSLAMVVNVYALSLLTHVLTDISTSSLTLSLSLSILPSHPIDTLPHPNLQLLCVHL